MSVTSYDAINTLEYATATDFEQFGNVHRTGIIDGCGVTESASTMTVTVASGKALVDGEVVAVAGDDVTLTADPSNKRWNIVYIDSNGAPQVAVGDAAPDANTEPAKPTAPGAILKMYKVEGGQTIAANVTVALDKAVQTHPIEFSITKSADQSVTSSTTLVDDDDLTFSADANSTYLVQIWLRMSGNSAGDMKFGFSLPSGASCFGTWKSDTAGTWDASNDLTTADVVQAATEENLFPIYAYIDVGATAGDVTFQWAQNASNATATTVHEKTYMTYRKVA